MIIPLSIYDDDNDVYVGMPAILNKDGVERRIRLKLTQEECDKLQYSIDVIKDNIEELNKNN